MEEEGSFLFLIMECVVAVSADGDNMHTLAQARMLWSGRSYFARMRRLSQSFLLKVLSTLPRWVVCSLLQPLDSVFMCAGREGSHSSPLMMSQFVMGICHYLMPPLCFRSFIWGEGEQMGCRGISWLKTYWKCLRKNFRLFTLRSKTSWLKCVKSMEKSWMWYSIICFILLLLSSPVCQITQQP